MGIIELEGMEFFAYHGHFKSEQIVGNTFIVNLKFETDCSRAGISDNLNDTVNYQEVYTIIKNEMDTKSYLLENLGTRILDVLYANFKSIKNVTLKISKLNPPMGGQINRVSVTLCR